MSTIASTRQRFWKVASYNVTAFTPRKPLQLVLYALASNIVGLQSTGLNIQANAAHPEYRYERQYGYHILHFPKPHDVPVAGCTIAFETRRFSASSIRKIFTPPSTLLGRAGACRLRRRGQCDFTPIVAYFPQPGLENLGGERKDEQGQLK